jgi:hypothetical protein
MSRPGTGSTPATGRNRSTSTPTGTMAMRAGSTSWSETMSLNELSDTVMIRGNRLATRVCMAVNEYHRRITLHRQQAVAEALVVVHQIELAGTPVQVLPGSETESQGLGELAGRERRHLDEVGPTLELPQARHPHREVVVVDVEAGQFDQPYPRIEDGKGLTGQNLDVVSEVDHGLRQMPHVDALTAHVGLAPIGEQRDTQPTFLGMHSCNLSVPLTGGSRPPAVAAVIHHDRGPPSRRRRRGYRRVRVPPSRRESLPPRGIGAGWVKPVI